jgi:iron complex outermembrane receptor protein
MLTHEWIHATELDVNAGTRRDVPLTPRQAASLNVTWEGERWGRIGFEAYLVGRQALDDDPYLAEGRCYALVGLLGERPFGRVRAFLNLENLFDVRQTKDAPLVRPARLPDGRWTVGAWAPLDGRTLNGGVRVAF